MNFWSEQTIGREKLIQEMVDALETEGWSYSTDTGWNEWDVQIYGSFWWIVRFRSVTEYHGGPKCLTRVALQNRIVATTFLANVICLCILAYQYFFTEYNIIWLLVPYLTYVTFLAYHARRLKRRVAELVEAAAQRSGLTRIFGRAGEPASAKAE